MSDIECKLPNPLVMAEVRALVELLLDYSKCTGSRPIEWRKECHDLAIYLARVSAKPVLIAGATQGAR